MTKRTRRDPHHPTPHLPSDDRRKAVDLSPTENADLCSGCVKCCTYITVEVDPPRQAWEYDQWIWTIDHHGIEMLLEKPEKWFVHVDTQCRHLQGDGRCAIYGSHPVLCREYDPRECERRLPLSDIVATFRNGDELAAWIAEHRPVHYRRLVAYRGGPAPGWPGGPPTSDRGDSPRSSRALRPAIPRNESAQAGFIPLALVASSLSKKANVGPRPRDHANRPAGGPRRNGKQTQRRRPRSPARAKPR